MTRFVLIAAAGKSLPTAADDAQWFDELERRGTLRRATGKLPRGWLTHRPNLEGDLVGALLGTRADGR